MTKRGHSTSIQTRLYCFLAGLDRRGSMKWTQLVFDKKKASRLSSLADEVNLTLSSKCFWTVDSVEWRVDQSTKYSLRLVRSSLCTSVTLATSTGTSHVNVTLICNLLYFKMQPCLTILKCNITVSTDRCIAPRLALRIKLLSICNIHAWIQGRN